MKKLTTKKLLRLSRRIGLFLLFFCPAYIEGEWHFWIAKLFTQGIEAAGKELAIRCIFITLISISYLFSGTGMRWQVRRVARTVVGSHPLLFDPEEDEPLDRDLEWTEEPKKVTLKEDGVCTREEVESTLSRLTLLGFTYCFSKSYGEETHTYRRDGLTVEIYSSKEAFYCMVKPKNGTSKEFSKSHLLPSGLQAEYRNATPERKLQIICDMLCEAEEKV